ncbi:anaphase-promoting complex subunit cdc27 [Exophiala xenobiotica]|uniref:Anaphase-promoting complex subunit cdc27 n=1 Tax=Vermiconidia calcicola TaxID=1690605 RepID=A0AAV9QAI3_9PEZI|nr:anaphase-promoting complex subunit cdc27 [Exophiala xenobiotica]KAK5536941.1 anaphase-promoting complex subunit cdc27 [Chaetothyriales sp. CCFEE 6169]KAK5537622.1 anaphase-promoting complex subunit cdc27 [Vermiconidia calcicola]KAK5267265.1 anaphase-promoting complex subunit cdc27 [Exophiala xenobiotica]KAK5291499.1 anaphase-promoting complex subunit cdc27 [Exophiala xenobiotica]
MAPTVAHIAGQLRQLIYYHLDNNLLKNALFLAARLLAYEPRSAEAAYLLSYCQYQSGFLKAAWDTSRSAGLRGSHLGCSYVFAQASLELGRYVDGLTALEKSKHLWQNRNTWGQHNESRRQHLPDAAAVFCLKGKLWKAHKNIDQAVESWAAALKLNPFMWDAFAGLSESGAKVSVPNIYKMSAEVIAATHLAQQQTAKIETANGTEKVPASSHVPQTERSQLPQDPFVSSHKANGNNSVLWEKLNGSKISVNTASTILDEEGLNTPSTEPEVEDAVLNGAPINQFHDPPPAPVRKMKSTAEVPADPPPRWKTGSSRVRAKAKGPTDDTTVLQDPPPPAAPSKRTVSGQPTSTNHTSTSVAEGTRRSNRLLNTTRQPSASSTAGSKISSLANTLGLREGRDIKKAKAPAVRARTANASTVGRVVSGNRTRTGSADAMDVDSKEQKSTNIPPVPPLPNARLRAESIVTKELEAIQTLLDLFGRLASAQLCLANYDCQTAIQIYNSLPSAQRETPYVLAQIGKAYYEQAQYVEADKFFVRVRQLAPTRLEDMEIYSTVLWHLKNEIELANLAHELIELERLSPQAWCAIGNSFSLQREHEQALKCFRRSTQLDSQFAYGFTLQGHEYISNEEFEKALEAYRSAIAADGRHYNAWYGLGKVYEKMGKWSIAEQHYRTAAKINPTNAVLICCIGLVLERLKEPEKALQMYTRACALAPNSALGRFKKARCLMSLGRPRDALTELLVLRDVAPDEANVWFLMGRLYKTLREKANAVRAFTMALNLDPKAAQFIKDAMESLDDEDEDGYDEDEDMD